MPGVGKYIRTEATKQKLREVCTGRSAANKGISNLKFYGEEKAKEMKQKQIENATNGTNRRGKTDIEFYGAEKAKLIRDKISAAVSVAKRADEYGGRGYVKKDPNSKGNYKFIEWATAVKQRDNYTCQGQGPHKGKISAHHIKDWENFPSLRYDVNNGIAFCNACHGREHARIDQQIRIAFQKALYLIRYIELSCLCGNNEHKEDCAIGKLAKIIKEATSLPQDRGNTTNPISIEAHYEKRVI